jgi:ankyrin repeat protein
VEKLIVKCYGNGNKSPELRDVLQILRTLVEEVFDSVTMVLDGLDEVKDCDRQNINQAFKSLWGGTKPIKLLLCSRDDDVSAMTPTHVFKHRLQVLPTTISDDIKVYVTHSVRTLLADGSLVVGDEDLEQLIIDCLVDGAKGMFLWVKFQLAELCTAETDSEVNRILETLPKDLGETYDRLLGRINGEQREDLVRRMFQWIICAKRPLYIDELREAIAFGIEDRHWDGSKIPTQILRVVRACGNLVVISEETRHVSLAHYTVQQYVLGKPYDLGSSIHFTMEEANIAVAQVCIAYLCFSDFESQVSKYMDTTNNDMKLIQEMVSSLRVVPDDYRANRFLKIRDYFRGGPSGKPKQIDYRRYVNARAPNENLLQKFRILEYISNNWLLHSTCLDHHMDKASRTYQLFQTLILHKNLLFNVFPWNHKYIQNREVVLIAQAGWAIEAQHLLLLAVLTDDNPDVYLMNRAGVKLHGLWPYKSVLERKTLEKIPKDSESIPETIERAYMWLYSKVLSACRQGNGSLLTGLKSGLLSVYGSMGQPTSSWVGSSLSLEDVILGHMLFEASMHGQEKLVADIMDSLVPFSKLFLEHDGYYFSLKTMAALRGHVNILKMTRAPSGLAGLFMDPSLQRYLEKALVGAAGNSNGAVVEGLLMIMQSAEASPQHIEAKNSALRKSTQESAHEIVLLLLENGGDPLDEGPEGDSALEIAVRCGNVEVVRTLVDYSGFNITSPVQVEKFETHCTSTSSAQHELKKHELYELGTHATSNSDTQLRLTKSKIDLLRYHQQAAIGGSRVRRQRSFTFQKQSKIIDFYLRIAISLGHNEIATIFIDMFADNNSQTNVIEDKKSLFRGYMMTTLLSIAVANGHLKTVQLLLDKGAEVDWFSGPVGDLLQSNSRGAPNFPNRQMFGDEIFLGHFSGPVVQTADKDKGGMSALLCAIWFGHDEILKLLLNYRALFEADESQRAWALDLACQNYRSNTALMLLARHSREWTETTDGLIFKLDTLKKIEGFGGVDVSRTERVNILVWMEVRRRREEMESWMERPA